MIFIGKPKIFVLRSQQLNVAIKTMDTDNNKK